MLPHADLSKISSAQDSSSTWLPTIDPNLVAAATVGSAAFGAISAINSFRQVSELKAINAKLDKIIDLQVLTIKAIKDLGIQFRIDLEDAFIKDVELELKSCHQSFKTLTDVMIERDEGILFPSGGPDYQQRLESLMWKTQDLTNKLAGYGHPTHQALFASMIILDSMFKVARVDRRYRIAYLNQRAADISGFEQTFLRHQQSIIKENDLLWTKEAITGIKDIDTGHNSDPNAPYFQVRGNPRDGFEMRGWIRTSQPAPDFVRVSDLPKPQENHWFQIQTHFRQNASNAEGMKVGVLALITNVKTSTSDLIKIYETA